MISVIPIWIKIVAVLGVLGVAFSCGWYVEGLRWAKDRSATELALKQNTIDALKANLSIINEALKQDTVQALEDAKNIEEIERITNDVVAKIANRPCLDSDGVERLRSLFDK